MQLNISMSLNTENKNKIEGIKLPTEEKEFCKFVALHRLALLLQFFVSTTGDGLLCKGKNHL